MREGTYYAERRSFIRSFIKSKKGRQERLFVKMFDDEECHKRCEEHVFEKLGLQPNVELLRIKKRNTSAEIYIPCKLRDDEKHDVFAVR